MKTGFKTDNKSIENKYQDAIRGLLENTKKLSGLDKPVLVEGGVYPGIWLESGPLESLTFGMLDPEITLASHRIFFRMQREDGYIPFAVLPDGIRTGQIQMVVPIAATACEASIRTGDEGFMDEAYTACSKWDAWLSKYRDTRGTGLCELFCEYDTGHDNSPRVGNIPGSCPEEDARICPEVGTLPYLAPDLSATVYGGRVALSRMARLLNRRDEADRWQESAEAVRRAILAYCFDPEDMCFYDLDCRNKFIRIRGDLLTRVLSEHVVDGSLFEEIFRRHIINPDEFWTPYPLPSIAANDPAFVHELPTNSWGGASQALTALRAPRWFEYYRKPAHLTHLMKRWVKAIVACEGFKQQMNPWTGEFSTTEMYSPSMCVMIDFVSRLFGIRCEDGYIEWNCRIPEGAAYSSYTMDTPHGTAKILKNVEIATLYLCNKEMMQVTGNCRIVTDKKGLLIKAVGTELVEEQIKIELQGGVTRSFAVGPNVEITLDDLKR